MNKKLKIVIAVAVVLAMVFPLAGCGKKGPETPWEWAQSLEDGDIKSAVFWFSPEYFGDVEDEKTKDDIEASDDENTEIELNNKQTEKLLSALLSLKESNFTENSEAGDDVPLYGIKIKMSDGSVYELNHADAPEQNIEMTYADKQWLIDSVMLNAFLDSLMSGTEPSEDDYKYASSADMIVSGSDLTDSDYGFVTYSDLT